ncbi:ROK family member transcriptional repressor [Lunatimonas lonarensis]|uniref:ROK family member transcriptional repressor n=1 Tax=Lunatimonas lonarensis TaxID=1232681 RepID=R7ZWU8_9BACT|nr:ROK family protein [Lunatimonas lonarensis]EON78552.1 ROK family member transcriptional repressor [Lunatimonas lonarensis]
MQTKKVVGVDVGGSHITAGWVDLQEMRLDDSSVVRSDVDSLGSKDQVLDGWIQVLSRFELSPSDCIGIAMPAPFDYERGISLLKEQGKFRSLYGVNVREHLAKGLGIHSRQIFFSNDAASFLQGEALFQRFPPNERVIGITLGTGLGSAYRFGERAVDAELWSSPFKAKQAEDYLGTNWFVKWAMDVSGLSISGPKELVLTAPELAHRAFTEYGKNLGEFLAKPIREHGIERVILGGNITKGRKYFHEPLLNQLKEKQVNVEINFSQLGENAVLLGAASNCEYPKGNIS